MQSTAGRGDSQHEVPVITDHLLGHQMGTWVLVLSVPRIPLSTNPPPTPGLPCSGPSFGDDFGCLRETSGFRLHRQAP